MTCAPFLLRVGVRTEQRRLSVAPLMLCRTHRVWLMHTERSVRAHRCRMRLGEYVKIPTLRFGMLPLAQPRAEHGPVRIAYTTVKAPSSNSERKDVARRSQTEIKRE